MLWKTSGTSQFDDDGGNATPVGGQCQLASIRSLPNVQDKLKPREHSGLAGIPHSAGGEMEVGHHSHRPHCLAGFPP